MTFQADQGDAFGSPSDDELVEYLLQPPADGDGRFVHIERWLASDESNLMRLESIAEAVLIAAEGLPRLGQQPIASSHPAVKGRPPETGRPFRLSLRWAVLTLAASILIALGMRFGPFAVAPSPGPSTGRVALAWSEIDSISDLDAWEMADEATIEWEEPPAVAAWVESESVTYEDDAAAGGAPPEWMLIAITRMPASELPGVAPADEPQETLR